MAARKPSPAAVAAAMDNPFEKQGNKSLKFDVLGRRVKGAGRNVTLARSKAFERREKTLASELRASKQANSFVDRRFGENDASMDTEAKMLVRLQKERRRQLRMSSKKSKYNLGEGDAGGEGSDMLTHFGRALSDMEAFDSGYPGPRGGDGGGDDDGWDEEGDAMMESALTAAHFGGGDGPVAVRGQRPIPAWAAGAAGEQLFDAAAGGAADGSGAKRSYKEIMEEVIAKSKAYKAEKADEKAALNAQLAKLDMQADTVARLLHESAAQRALATKETAAAAAGAARNGAAGGAPAVGAAIVAAATGGAPAVDTGYDSLLMEIARSSRAAAATDGTKSAEEAAAEEAKRLNELEGLRQQRMTAEVGASGGAGGVSGDYLGPTISNLLTVKQKKAARGGASILDYAADAAAAKAAAAAAEEEEEEYGDGSDDDSDDDDDEDDDDEDDEDEEDDDLDIDEASVASGTNEEDTDEEPPAAKRRAVESAPAAARRGKAASSSASPVPVAVLPSAVSSLEDMPYVLPCPGSWDAFHGLVGTYCAPLLQRAVTSSSAPAASAGASTAAVGGTKRKRPADDASSAGAASSSSSPASTLAASEAVYELLRRIRANHAITLRASNRTALATLYAVLLRDLLVCGGAEDPAVAAAASGSSVSGGVPMWRVQPVMRHLLEMSRETALQPALVAHWKAVVAAVTERIEASIAKGAVGVVGAATGAGAGTAAPPASASWPTAGEMLLVQAARHVFPTSDSRHVVVTTLSLLLAQTLVQVPLRNVTDVCRGLTVAAGLLELTRDARRYVPEVTGFVGSVLRLFAGAPSSSAASGGLALPPLMPNASPLATSAGALLSAALSFTSTSGSGTRIPFSVLTSALTAKKDGTAPSAYAAAVASAGASGVPSVAQLAHAALHAAAAVVFSLAQQLVPEAFASAVSAAAGASGDADAAASATRSERLARDLMAAALAPYSGAAASVVHAMEKQAAAAAAAAAGLTGASAGGAPIVPSSGAISTVFLLSRIPAPQPTAPEVLDPLVAALTTIVALASGSSGKAAAAAAAVVGAIAPRLQRVIALRDAAAAYRAPLRLHDASGPPPAVRAMAPLVEDVNAPKASAAAAGSLGRKVDEDEEAAQMRQQVRALAKQKKRELRGAMRELRKDREFIVRDEDKEKASRAAERDAKYRQVMVELETQQATFKQMTRKGNGLNRDKEEASAAVSASIGRTKKDRLAKKDASRAASSGSGAGR